MAKDNTSRKWVRQWRRGETADLAVDAALDKIAEAIKCEASEDEEIALSPADKAWNALSPADRAHAVWLKAKVRGWDAPDENAAKVLWYKIEGAAFERDVIDFKLSAVERKRLKQIETIISKAERLLAVANDK